MALTESEMEAMARLNLARWMANNRECSAHIELDVQLMKSGIELDSPAAVSLHAIIAKGFREANQ